ncbi:MAG: BrnT family toxin [Kofleriaceae bacterium]|nr:BrnT family toxin [Kofleriaceae bacterium]
MTLRFDWDADKNKANRRKHTIWFEEAQTVFDDAAARVFFDAEHSSDEDRFVIIKSSSASRLLVVFHCVRMSGAVIRIISARKATKKERYTYEERI